MRKVVKILFLVPVIYLAGIPFFLSGIIRSTPCSEIKVVIEDSGDYHFITKRNLLNMVNSEGGRILGKPLEEVQVNNIEEKIKELKELKKAEVYTDIKGTMHVFTDQRNAIIRIMPDDGGDFFMDDEGVIIRRRNLYSPRVHIAVGNITISRPMLNGVSVLDTSIKKSVLKDIYYIEKYISGDDFWSAQIDQFFVGSDGSIDLIPRVGNHIVHLGSAENLESKLKSLETFYEKVLPEVGWNKYSYINLEYRDQIVCKRR
jgi:cell division protein FtsQ